VHWQASMALYKWCAHNSNKKHIHFIDVVGFYNELFTMCVVF
jgi:hypothetical protein